MRRTSLSLLLVLLAALPAAAQSISDERPLRLSELAAGLRARAAAEGIDLAALGQQVAAALQAVPAEGAAPFVLSPEQQAQLTGLVQGAIAGDPAALAALDRFPGWKAPAIGGALRAELAALGAQRNQVAAPARVEEALGIPVADQTPPQTSLKPLGHGLFRGTVHEPDSAQRHPDSARLAEVFNRLSMNGTGWVTYQGERARTPRGVLALLERDGHTVEAHDFRSIANFSALYYQAPGTTTLREVAAPLWLDSGVEVPGTDRTLFVPATHSELVITVRGPVVNADVAFYLGTDNQARFRPTGSRRPSWTGAKSVRSFEGREALRAASAAAWVRRSLTRLAEERGLDQLRTGAYGQLGVCNDATALIEGALGLEATHWPLMRLPEVYRGTGRLERVSNALPYDGDPATVPGVERVLQSIPFAADEVPAAVFPVLADDMARLSAPARGLAGTATDALGN